MTWTLTRRGVSGRCTRGPADVHGGLADGSHPAVPGFVPIRRGPVRHGDGAAFARPQGAFSEADEGLRRVWESAESGRTAAPASTPRAIVRPSP